MEGRVYADAHAVADDRIAWEYVFAAR